MTALLPTLRRRGRVDRPVWDFFDGFFEDFGWPTRFTGERASSPPLDISETEKEYVIAGEIPGIDVKDLDITLTDGILTVKGEKNYGNGIGREDFIFLNLLIRCQILNLLIKMLENM